MVKELWILVFRVACITGSNEQSWSIYESNTEATPPPNHNLSMNQAPKQPPPNHDLSMNQAPKQPPPTMIYL
jgi:hypothetical protein